VLVWGAVHAGEAANAIPQHGVLRGTLRTADHATWNQLEDKVRVLVAAILAPLGVGYFLDHVRGVPPVVNEAVSSGMLAEAALAIGGPEASASTEQSSGGEDFAWFLDHVPGAMARLGVWSGSGPMRDIHQPTFDLDERALPFGVRVLTRAALSALSHTGESPVPPL
jgi:amidohydrolase